MRVFIRFHFYLLLIFPVFANSEAITDPSLLGNNRLLIDFSEFNSSYTHTENSGAIDAFTHTSGPLQIGNSVGAKILWSTDYELSVIGNSEYQLIDNGNWNSGRNGFTGLNARSGSMNFYFENPVMGVGGFINYIIAEGITSYDDVMLSVYGISNNLIETFNITSLAPVKTSSDNAGAFRGILLNSPDIFRFEVRNAGAVLDDLQFHVGFVSEPSSVILTVFGFIGLLRFRNKFI